MADIAAENAERTLQEETKLLVTIYCLTRHSWKSSFWIAIISRVEYMNNNKSSLDDAVLE